MVAPSEPYQPPSEPVLVDPFHGRSPPPPPKRPLSPAALASAILALLPIGSVAAIPIGVVGIRQTRLGTLRGRWLAITSIAIGALASIAYGGAAAYFAVNEAHAARQRDEQAEERRQRKREREEDDASIINTPNVPPRPSAPPSSPAGDVPKDTVTTEIGKITVVDLGVGEPSLKAAVVRELATAKAAGEEVLVMTCVKAPGPCLDVEKSLSDPLLQTALEKIRIVRINIEVFKDDIEKLGLQVDPFPVYALFTADGTPRDAIDGGEWEADIPQNIAPVLGPFVKGDLKKRKKQFKPGPGGGVFL
ncbi:MAG: DUF4190 domain-containing protein [Polyangiaceae bacterium]|nr:DUF4190 domain-containing protein [Polyangiaceae bacterium]